MRTFSSAFYEPYLSTLLPVIFLHLTNNCRAGLPNHMMGEVSWDLKRRRSWASPSYYSILSVSSQPLVQDKLFLLESIRWVTKHWYHKSDFDGQFTNSEYVNKYRYSYVDYTVGSLWVHTSLNNDDIFVHIPPRNCCLKYECCACVFPFIMFCDNVGKESRATLFPYFLEYNVALIVPRAWLVFYWNAKRDEKKEKYFLFFILQLS